MAVRTIHFTQEQAREVIGLSSETLRHWRKAVPFLQRKSGKAARFTFSDLIGLAVTQQLVSTFGVGIANVKAGVDQLFEVLSRADVWRLPNMIVIVSADGCQLRDAFDPGLTDADAAIIVVPCSPLIERLSGHVIPAATDPQSPLPFPPLALKVGTR